MTACTDDVGQFFIQGYGVLFSTWSENSSESKLHIWLQNIIRLKFTSTVCLFYMYSMKKKVLLTSACCGDGSERGK